MSQLCLLGREVWGSEGGWLGRPEPGMQNRMRLKAPGLYKWILLKWKFPSIPEISLAVRPGLVGLWQLGMWKGTKAKLSEPLRSISPGHPYLSSSPVPCSGLPNS